MAHSFKKVIDRMQWVQVAPTINAHSAGMGLASDLRNDVSRNPSIYQLSSATVLNRFNVITKGASFLISPALAGTFGAGAGATFAPSHSVIGTIAAGCTTSLVITSTVITAVAPNMLANRGGSGDFGFKIRIIGKVSGKTEERYIIGNTGGTTPSFRLDSPLTFTPANGDVYELLSGRVFMLGAGTLAAGSWKSFDVGTNTLATKTQTNLPATISTDFSCVVLDELYVPCNMKPGEGLIIGSGTYDGGSMRCLVATAVEASTITGQTSGGDALLKANQYKNYQIRIVEDTVNPTSVGQRRIVSAHTEGPSAVYTLGTAWTVTPSINAKFTVEYPNLIVLWSSGVTTTFVYNYGSTSYNNGTNVLASDSWSTSFLPARGVAMGAGCTSFASFGIELDVDQNARHSFIHSFRGGGSNALDILDISAGTWVNAAVYDGAPASISTGSCGKYSPFDNEGKFGYMNIYTASAYHQIFRYDVKNRVLSPFTPTDWQQTGTAAAGDRMASICATDGTDKFSSLFLISHLSTITMELVVEV